MDKDALQKVSLRKTGVKEPTIDVTVDSIRQEKEANMRLRACDLEAWYEPLKEWTFKTVFVDLTIEEAQAMVAYYESKERGAYGPVLKNLEEKIAGHMTELGGGGVFAKLSSRSPKDSQMCQDRALESVKKKLLEKGGKVDGNDVFVAIMGSSIGQSCNLLVSFFWFSIFPRMFGVEKCCRSDGVFSELRSLLCG
jgi:hypothetical protein